MLLKVISIVLLTAIATTQAKTLDEGSIDMQSHLGAHIPLPFIFKSPLATGQSVKTHKHMLQQTMYTQYLLDSKIDVWGIAAYPMYVHHKESILKQLQFFKNFAKENSLMFQIAYKADDLKEILEQNKRAIFLGIEGADKIIQSKEDVKMWKQQGVRLITPIHLNDNEFGAAWVAPGFLGILNPGGFWRMKVEQSDPGLTDFGKKAIQWLIDEGIMVDISHMSQKSVDDTLEIFQHNAAKPIMTHAHLYYTYHNNQGIKDEQIIKLYQLGGMMGLPANDDRVDPGEDIRPKKYCPGSIDGVVFDYSHVYQLLTKETNQQSFGLGISGDWNGFVSHLRPKYGEDGCYQAGNAPSKDPFHTQGLVHPGFIPNMMEQLGQEVDLKPYNSALKHFYRIWSSYPNQKE